MSEESPAEPLIYYGLSGIKLDFDSYDLGHGVTLSKTYLHVMSHPMVAFTPPSPGEHHPAPWQALKAKSHPVSLSLLAQLSVPGHSGDPKGKYDWVGWITLLLRFSLDCAITLTVSANTSFEDVAAGKTTANLLEPIRELFEGTTVQEDDAQWIKDNWYSSLPLSGDPALAFAVRLLYGSHRTTEELGVVSVWAALERLFSANAAELKYRVCTNIAAFLEPPGNERYLMFKQLTKLYDDRSAAAHGSPMKNPTAYMDSFQIASRAILRIIELGQVPTKDNLERELLSPSLPEPSFS
jgi:hypothetical protein